MKMRYLLLTLSLVLTFSVSYAGNSVNTEDNPQGTALMEDFMMDKAAVKAEQKLDKQLLKAEKRAYKAEKRMAWASRIINKKLAKSEKKALGGMDDPVDKWVWYAIILGGAGILLLIIASAVAVGSILSGGFGVAGFLYVLGWICMLAGTASIIYWLVKKFG